jgi:SHS2 domain-containing protein
MKYQFLPHTADIKFRAFGNSLEEVFINSALAIKHIMYKEKVGEKKRKKFIITGHDKENLLYEFLEEFLFLIETEKFLLSKIENMEINEEDGEYRLKCELIGDLGDYEIENHIKAITYNDMFIKEANGKFIAQVVVDV